MANQPLTAGLLRQILADTAKQYAYPPDVHFAKHEVPPPPAAYIGPDDNLQVVVYTTASTSGLNLSLRWLDAAGAMHYETETLDGVSTSTLTTKIFNLAEGWLLGVSVSNLGGGLADQVCFVAVGLQQTRNANVAPHTILAQGYVSNLFTVDWPPCYVRGPATGNLSRWNALLNSPMIPPITPTAYDDEFDAASLNLSKWAWVNQSTAAATLVDGYLVLDLPTVTGSQVRGIVETTPSTPYTFVTFVTAGIARTDTSNVGPGLGLRESATGKLAIMWLDQQGGGVGGSSNGCSCTIELWTNPTTFASAPFNSSYTVPAQGLFIRVANDGTHITTSLSVDGLSWTSLGSYTVASAFTTAPNQVGLFAFNQGTVTSIDSQFSFDFIRRTA